MPKKFKNYKDFSVIIPTYNRSFFVKQAIISILKQKNVSMEIIIGDDSSTDDTKNIVKTFIDKRIKYFRNKERLGSSLNMRKCFLHSLGNYIFLLGDDDFILDENTLFEVLKVMRKYKIGMGRIGTVVYENSPTTPYQTAILSNELIVLRPQENVLTKSINFDLGFYSGLIFDNFLMNRDKFKMDHKCSSNHMCQLLLPIAYDLILKHGIAYIPNCLLVARYSLQMIPRYFNIEKHGRFFIEEPLIKIKGFIKDQEYEYFKKEYIRNKLILLPNIKYFSDNKNYINTLFRMIRIDKTLLAEPKFFVFALAGFMPKFIIKLLRNFMIYFSKDKVREEAKKYNYFQKIEKLGLNF